MIDALQFIDQRYSVTAISRGPEIRFTEQLQAWATVAVAQQLARIATALEGQDNVG